jgi:pentatricopeptide repeat protein
LFRQAVADPERVLCADHPQIRTSRNALAGAYLAAGRVDEAIALFQQTLANRERVLGADHPDSLATRSDLECAQANAHPLLIS